MRTQILNGKRYCKFSEVVKYRGEYIDYIGKNTYCYNGKYDLLVWLDYEKKNEYIIIPKGYVFDFGSVPTAFRWISEKDDYVSYIVHDYLYQRNGEVLLVSDNKKDFSKTFKKLQKHGFGYSYEFGKGNKIVFKYDRKFADLVLYKFMEVEDIEILRQEKILKHKLIYYGIRIGGKRHFKNSRILLYKKSLGIIKY